MANFDYDAEKADFLTIRFKCVCGNEVAVDKDVKNVDSKVFVCHCENCGKNYEMTIHTEENRGYGTLSDVPQEKFIIAEESLFENYKKMDCSFVDYAEGITHLERSIEYVDKIENDEVRDFLLRMLLCNAISIFDLFFKQAFSYLIGDSASLLDRFRQAYYGNWRRPSNIASDFIESKSFQNVDIVVRILRDVFNVDFEADEALKQVCHELRKSCGKRNEIIHRNSIRRSGMPVIVSSQELHQTINNVRIFIHSANKALLEKEAECCANKL